MARSHPPSIPNAFITKKARILSLLTQSEDEYTDNSPKGTVDTQIRDLIDEINAHDGLVTTSSCAGRVAVFVEGPRVRPRPERVVDEVGNDGVDGRLRGEGRQEEVMRQETKDITTTTTTTVNTTTTPTTASPGGKGGGRWLYVSHEPIPEVRAGTETRTAVDATQEDSRPSSDHFTKLFNLSRLSDARLSRSTVESPSPAPPRLIHLTFSPLILHIHCATLQHARPVLTAAVNAGFRESGVQSLRILDDPEHGVMVAVRTAGLSFETAVGVVVVPWGHGEAEAEGAATGEGEEVMQSIVNEEYLAMCAGVVNERFAWNDERRERFRAELRRAMQRDALSAVRAGRHEEDVVAGWEDKDERRRRKREQGLERQKQQQQQQQQQQTSTL